MLTRQTHQMKVVSSPNHNRNLDYASEVKGAALLILLIIVGYLPLEPSMHLGEAATSIERFRVYFLIPVAILLVIMAWRFPKPRTFNAVAATSICLAGLSLLLIDYTYSSNHLAYLFISAVHVAVMCALGLGMSLRLCLLVFAPVLIANSVYLLFFVDTATPNFFAYSGGLFGSFLIVLSWTWIRDQDEKHNDHSRESLARSQTIRRRWYQYFYGSVKTRVEDAMADLTSKIEQLPTRPTVQRYTERCNAAFTDTQRLISKLLSSLSWREALSNERRTMISAKRLALTVARDFQVSSPSTRFRLEATEDFIIFGDVTLLRRALSNIVDNAVRLHKPGTRITIGTQDHRIYVENEGSKIPENITTLFRFGAGGDVNNRGMFGLGLFLVKQICDNHGVSISTRQKGEQARFTLQFSPADKPTHKPERLKPSYFCTEFQSNWLNGSKLYIRTALIVSFLLVMMFYPVDPLVLHENSAYFLQDYRLYFMVPGIFMLFGFSLLKGYPPLLYFTLMSLIYLVAGVSFIYACSMSPINSSLYMMVALVQTLLFVFSPCRIPALIAIPFGWLLYGYLCYSVQQSPFIPPHEQAVFYYGFATLLLLLNFSSIQRDKKALKSFRALSQAEKELFDQGLWSAYISRVLRHELGNQLTGISSSLQLMALKLKKDSVSGRELASIEACSASVEDLRQLLIALARDTHLEPPMSETACYEFDLTEAINNACFNVQSQDADMEIHHEHDALMQNNPERAKVLGDRSLITFALETALKLFSTQKKYETDPAPLKIRASVKQHETFIDIHTHEQEGKEEIFAQTDADAREHLEAANGGVSVDMLEQILALHSANLSVFKDMSGEYFSRISIQLPNRQLGA